MPRPELTSIHNVVGQDIGLPFINGEGELDSIPVRWMAFAKSNINWPGDGPVNQVFISTAKVPFHWDAYGGHGQKSNGACTCKNQDCRRLSMSPTSEDVAERLAWFVKLEERRQYQRDYTTRKKAAKASA